jgi:nucleotide-binding universal stress UspA family protein
MFKTVLFPIDQSRNSQDAAEKVAALVKFCESRLVILTVAPDPSENEAADPTEAEQLLASAKTTFADWGIPTETLLKAGKPAFCICDVADEIGADLIMMGCRGIGLTDDHPTESVSNRVINLAPCPVLVIP